MTKILILHPGAMGSSLGSNLVENGHSVLWVSKNRSAATCTRATRDQLTRVSTLSDALPQVDIVMSVCPPEHAVEVGQVVAQTGYEGTYCDANAIAPVTATKLLEVYGERYVDGGIVGPPARTKGHTRLYLSGLRSTLVARLFENTRVQAEVLQGEPCAASAMKMCYAAYTKGSAALILGIRALAEHYGVSGTLRKEWDHSQSSLWDRSERMGPGTSRKAWRFAPEMLEIAKSFAAAGLPPSFHTGAAEIYSRLAILKDVEDVPTSTVLQYLLEARDRNS